MIKILNNIEKILLFQNTYYIIGFNKSILYITKQQLGYLLMDDHSPRKDTILQNVKKIGKWVTKFYLESRKKTCSVSITISKHFNIKLLPKPMTM